MEDCDDVIVAFTTVEATMEQVNKECVEAAAKPSKRPHTKKSDAAAGGHEIGDETAVIGESSRPKRKSTSASGEREALRAKKAEGKLTLAAAILQANNLTFKTKLSDVGPCTSPWRTGLGNTSRMAKTLCRARFRQTRYTSLLIHWNTAYLWRRGRSKFSWSGRLLVRSEGSQSSIAFRSSEPQYQEGDRRTKGTG